MHSSHNDSDAEPDAGELPSDEELLSDEELPSLPVLTDTAAVYSGCCLALSTPLVAHLHSLLPRAPTLTLSIGSGFGLLEALLAASPYNTPIVGVEVEPSPNAYLPKLHHRTVHGSRFLEPLAADAEAWLFVYPRRVALLSEYMTAYGCDSVQTIVWAGPQADWEEYMPCFTVGWNMQIQSAQEVGGKPWELIAIARKAST